MKLLELYWGYLHGRWGNRCIHATNTCVMLQTQCVEWNEVLICWTCLFITNMHWLTYQTGLSQSVYAIWEQLHSSCVNSCKGYSQETFIVAFKSVDGLYTKLWMNLTCALCSGLMKQDLQVVEYFAHHTLFGTGEFSFFLVPFISTDLGWMCGLESYMVT